jgi:hypothetical protein
MSYIGMQVREKERRREGEKERRREGEKERRREGEKERRRNFPRLVPLPGLPCYGMTVLPYYSNNIRTV